MRAIFRTLSVHIDVKVQIVSSNMQKLVGDSEDSVNAGNMKGKKSPWPTIQL